MGGVLGVSVGSGFVRIVRREPGAGHFDRRTLVVDDQVPETLAAESIGVLLAGDEESGSLPAVGIAYTDESQAAALDAALRREGTADYRLIPELSAVVGHLGATGALTGLGTVVVLDLGHSGSTVSVVDAESGDVHATERTPTRSAAGIEEAVDLAHELLTQSGRGADAVVLVGGGAHAEGVRAGVAGLAGLPVVVPEAPELSAASGAALLGGGVRACATPSHRPESHRQKAHRPRAHRRGSRRNVSRRQVRSAGAAGVMLALLAVVGFGLGYGRTLFGSAPDESEGRPVTSSVTVASAPPPLPPSVPPSAPETVSVETPETTASADTPPAANDMPRQLPPAPPAPGPLATVLDALTGLPLPPLPPLESLPLPPIPQIPGL